MKTLNDIKQDMSELYDQVKSGVVELKAASELANIAGKYLKAEQLSLAREMFLKDSGHKLEALPGPNTGAGGGEGGGSAREAAPH